ncbi:MBOAT family O-acyltransferase [Singulisphaera sp. PoT]|uniref:MBOAT family O-acyltransferase n=1 Tax=Singulisphaera sp. PoT TaxID=3411797 RepID=UPI003BF52619
MDLFTVRFWLVFGLAFFLLNSLKNGTARKWAFALVNLGFLGLYLTSGVLVVIVLIAMSWVVIKLAAQEGKVATLAMSLGGLGLLCLFLIHKLPSPNWTVGHYRINAIFTTLGFSYVALRLVDVTRAVADKRYPPPDPIALVNYLIPFHMLAAGPIQSYDDFVKQPAVPEPAKVPEALAAWDLIATGLFKKYVLADLIERIFLTGFRVEGPYMFFEAQLNYIWIYLDFSAYSDIALGLGSLMGVATPINFNRPYLARNVIDYWERWHISLSLFIRRHLFTPIQLWLMRSTDGRFPIASASIAFFVSFLLCGLWHSVGPVWLIWGVLHALALIVCNLYKSFLLKRLGRNGVKNYLANPWIRVAAIFLTFEFIAAVSVVVTYPISELTWWNAYPR